jgi:hypothetical protein
MQTIQEKYKSDPRVKMDVLDNSHGHGNSRSASLGDLRAAPDENELAGRLRGVLEKANDSGAISTRIYKATKGAGGGYEVGM